MTIHAQTAMRTPLVFSLHPPWQHFTVHRDQPNVSTFVERMLRSRIDLLAAGQNMGHPGGNLGANLKSISHRCHPILVTFLWELTTKTINLPLGCLQGGRGGQTVRNIALRVRSWQPTLSPKDPGHEENGGRQRRLTFHRLAGGPP